MRCLFSAAGLLASAASAQAATCTVSATSGAFGTHTFLVASPSDSTGSITVSCDAGASYSLGILGGFTGTFTRAITSGSNRLAYNLFTDATRTVVWGDGTAGSARVSSSGTAGATHTGVRPRSGKAERAGGELCGLADRQGRVLRWCHGPA